MSSVTSIFIYLFTVSVSFFLHIFDMVPHLLSILLYIKNWNYKTIQGTQHNVQVLLRSSGSFFVLVRSNFHHLFLSIFLSLPKFPLKFTPITLCVFFFVLSCPETTVPIEVSLLKDNVWLLYALVTIMAY